jgi:hypothetical protein
VQPLITAIASEAVAAEDLHDRRTRVLHQVDRRRRRFGIAALLKETGLVLLVVLMCPVAILIVGAPVALLVRLLIEIAERL